MEAALSSGQVNQTGIPGTVLTWSQSFRSSTRPKARESSRQLRDKVKFHPEGTTLSI